MNPPKWDANDARKRASGRIWIDGAMIRYESSAYEDFQVAAGVVRVVGEFTNQNGPMTDDWFQVFITPERVLSASVYAEGMDEFMRELRLVLPGLLYFGLQNSTDFKSRILFPPEMAGAPLFTFRDHKPVGLVERLTSLVLPGVDLELTEDVRKRSGNSQPN